MAGATPRGRGGTPSEEPTLVLAGRAWRRGRLQPTEIGIGDTGTILAVGRNVDGARRRDLGEMVLMPSATDLHVHFRDPGPGDVVESFATGTLQAVLGGVGTVGEMPNTDPLVDSVDRLETKAARVTGRAACDVLLYAAATSAAQVRRLGRSAGAFKLFASPTTGIEAPPPEGTWGGIFAAAREVDLPIAVHAESPARFVGTAEEVTDLPGWDHHRPIAAERACVEVALGSARSARLHVAHATSSATVDAVRSAGYSVEATPHHLLLSTAAPGLEGRGKVNPPLRAEPERRALFHAFRDGRVPILASDHAPHPLDRKDGRLGRAASGMPGVETMLPLMLAQVARGELSLPVLLAAASERPARWFGRPTGRLAPGHRADLVAVDFRRKTRLRARDLHAPAEWTAFEGWEAVRPLHHYLAGEEAVRDGEYVGRPRGRVVRPEFARR